MARELDVPQFWARGLCFGDQPFQFVLLEAAAPERVLDGLFRRDQPPARGDGVSLHLLEDRIDGCDLFCGERDLVLEFEEMGGTGHAVQFCYQCQPPAAAS